MKQTSKKISASPRKVKLAIARVANPPHSSRKSPDEIMATLFDDVQRQRLYEDGKTFVDMVPRRRLRAIEKEYEVARFDPDFSLAEFVSRYFYTPETPSGEAVTDAATAREHVRKLWPSLKREARKSHGSLIALPYPYIVPGGRFGEQFYWDSYFTMLGLAADGEWPMIRGMVKNYAHMLTKCGKIPTANRSYFLSRSQPPFLAHMVRLLSEKYGKRLIFAEFLPALLAEYRFWMKGRSKLGADATDVAYARLVKMPDGTLLNRYFDDKTTPRPESRFEDLETAEATRRHDKNRIFLDLRAAAESGWDFSSRWFRDTADIKTIHTTDLAPVDLNCLLYQLETTIAEAYDLIGQGGLARRFRGAAESRADAVRNYFWDDKAGLFVDYDAIRRRRVRRLTLAGIFPLYAGIATNEQAAAAAKIIEQDFLKTGGLVATLVESGQQWDSPNGWAPLHWIAIQGLKRYGYNELADTIRDRWCETNERVFNEQHKMIEKYDVITHGAGGGGEYPLQDGFGWTNGVYAALKDEQERGA